MELSESQERAVAHDRGCLRIVACPGSGKTETVSRRVARLIGDGADPSKIVAFTFTRKAADSLKARIRGMLDGRADVGDMYVGTIDAFCLYMLKKIKPQYRAFEVLDGARRAAFLSRWYRKIELDRLDGGGGKWRVIEEFGDSVDRAVTEGVDMSRVRREFAECSARYSEKLREERFFDFVGVISALVEALQDGPAYLARVGEEVKHVVFDEYQDVNRIQERLLELLSRGADSVCVVGDDDQNIFQWRGSDISHIRRYAEKYAEYGVSTEQLGTNYRATDALVSMAGRFIARNRSRIPKSMSAHAGQPNRFEPGDIAHRHFGSDSDEFGFVRDTMESLRGTAFAGRGGRVRPLSYRDMAVLVRTNKDASRAAKALSGRGIPCVTDSGAGIFERPVVALALDCMMHAFGEEIPAGDLAAKYAEAVPGGDARAFAEKMARVRAEAERVRAKEADWLPGRGLQEFYHRVLSAMGAESGALPDSDMYGLAVLSKAISDYEYVYRFIFASQVRGLRGFVENVPDYEDPELADPGRLDAVRVMTIWKAKGLEFPVVFVTSFDDRKRPPQDSVFIDDGLYESGRYKGGEEDDRRAYYTAVTRSQKYLFLTSSSAKAGSKRSAGPHAFAAEMRGPEMSAAGPLIRPKASGSGDGAPPGALFKSSYNNLASYDRCPHEYKLRHVMGFNPGVPLAFGYGYSIHNILNYLHDQFARGAGVPDRRRIERAFDEMFYLRFAPAEQAEHMKRSGAAKVAKYVSLHGGDFGRIRETEKRFEMGMGGAMISGSMDLVKDAEGGGVEIVDFKTGRSGDGGYEFDYKAQVLLYAHAARAALGYEPRSATIYNLDAGVEPVDVGPDALDRTAAIVEKKISMIMSERFEPSPEEKKCRTCDFKALCEHKGFEEGPLFEPNQKRAGPPPGAGDDGPAGTSGESVKSRNVMAKAKRLSSRVAKNPDGTFSVPSSSEPGKSYRVSADMKCACRGFASYPERHPGRPPTCSHVEAVREALR